MQTMVIKSAALSILLFAVFSAAAPGGRFIRDPVFEEGIYARAAAKGASTTFLAALPTFYSFSLSKTLAADMGVVPAAAQSDIGNSELMRVANTKLRLSYNWANAVLATFGCKIPTGTNRMSGEQLATAGNIATRQCNFQFANLFNSLDLFGGVSSSIAFANIGAGDASIGFGCAYLYKSKFMPSAADTNPFDPGNELNVSLAAEYAAPFMNRPGSLLADIGYTYFGPDRFGAAEEIAPGSKFNWALTAWLGTDRSVPYSIRVANYRKGSNVGRSRFGETSKSANDLIATAVLPLPFPARLQPFIKFGAGYYSGGGVYPADIVSINAVIGTLGIGGSARCSEHLFAIFETAVDAGSMGGERIRGIETQAGIRFQF